MKKFLSFQWENNKFLFGLLLVAIPLTVAAAFSYWPMAVFFAAIWIGVLIYTIFDYKKLTRKN